MIRYAYIHAHIRCGSERIEEAGVEVWFETGAAHLVVTDDGAVAGVAWRRYDETGVVLAAAVVIAAGGYVMNGDMLTAYTPALTQKLFALGGTYDCPRSGLPPAQPGHDGRGTAGAHHAWHPEQRTGEGATEAGAAKS